MDKNLNKEQKHTETPKEHFHKEEKKESKFWKNKPMMKSGELSYKSSRLINLNDKKIYNSETSNILPDTLVWKVIESNDKDMLINVCNFLNVYYKEKNNIIFTNELLQFILGNDGFIMSIVSKNNIICGVVCVSFKKIIILDKNQKFACTQFLCSHPKFRNRGLTETLINEVIRYINIKKEIQQGLFITNNKIARPCATMRKYYRPINYHKLVKLDFLKLDGKEDVIHKKFAPSLTEESLNYIPMKKEHIDKVYEFYNIYKSQYNISVSYTKEELENLLLNNDIVKSYVILNQSNDNIIDFISYSQIQYKCTNNEIINAGQIFLYSLLNEYGESMMNNLIKIMNKNNIDIIYANDDKNITNILLTEKFSSTDDSDIETYEKIYEYKFIKKEKKYVYLFNWECPYLSSDKLNFDFII